MRFGLSPIQSNPDYEAMRQQARLAEALGFEALWAHEHHSARMMYPDPLMALAVMAGVTSRIGLGTNMLLLPIHHPVRVAQGVAMVDVLSGGRVRLGVANGYSSTDLTTFGVPRSERGRRLTEGIELIRELFSGRPVTRSGTGFDLEDFVLFPLPVQRPGPPILVGGHANVAIRRAARLGDHYLISTTASIDEIRQLVPRYHSALAELGAPPRAAFLNRVVCAVPNRAEKERALEFFARALLALYDSWGHDAITSLGAADRAREVLERRNLIIGEPNECIERIAEYAEIGVGHIACLMNFGAPAPAVAERSIRIFGERVIPHFA